MAEDDIFPHPLGGTPGFTPEKIRRMREEAQEISDELMEEFFKEETHKNELLSIKNRNPEYFELLMTYYGYIAFGEAVKEFKEKSKGFVGMDEVFKEE